MIHELPENKYYKIKPLIHGRKETNVHLLGVIDGNNRGKIYVNDIEEPETALIWAIGCVFAIIGNNTNGDFNQALLPFLRDCLGRSQLNWLEELIFTFRFMKKSGKTLLRKSLIQ